MSVRQIIDGGAHQVIDGPDGEQIAVWEYAPAKPRTSVLPVTLVFSHGWTLDHTLWIPLIERIQAEHNVRVVAYDQPGHGHTTLGKNPLPTIRSLGEALDTVIETTVPSGDLVVLVGHSMGGMTIMAYAGAHPERIGSRVRGVLMMGTSAGDITRRRQSVETALMRVIHRGPMIPTGHFIQTRAQRGTLFGDRCRPEDLAYTVGIMRATPLPTLSRYYLALMGHDELEHIGALATIPTVIMCGEKDRLTSTRHARRIHEAVRGSRLVIVPGAGHMLMFEALDLLAIELGALLHSV